MSRVDDAFKRAAAERRGDNAGREDRHPSKEPASLSLAQLLEDYPAEQPESAPVAYATESAELVSQAPATAAAQNQSGVREVEDPFDARVVSRPNVAQASIEIHRRLAATLHQLQIERGLKVLLVSSALPGEGKTLLCVNLALTLTRSFGRRVLLVDGDLRRPYLHRAFGIPGTTGLSDGVVDLESMPLIPVGEKLSLIPAGRPDTNATAVLASSGTKALLAAAAERFDWVILDSPPVAVLSDAGVMAGLVDGVVLVVKAGSTPYDVVRHAIEQLGRERVIGAVLNQVDEESFGPSEYDPRGYVSDTPQAA